MRHAFTHMHELYEIRVQRACAVRKIRKTKGERARVSGGEGIAMVMICVSIKRTRRIEGGLSRLLVSLAFPRLFY